jgi:hypothetical protein
VCEVELTASVRELKVILIVWNSEEHTYHYFSSTISNKERCVLVKSRYHFELMYILNLMCIRMGIK